MTDQLSPEELKKSLTEMQFYVTQNHGTESPFTRRLLRNKCGGIYHYLICDNPLFRSETKYSSGCGWPSSYEPVNDEAIRRIKDTSHNMQHTEIRCGDCDTYLGHVSPDGPKPTGEQCYVNSAPLNFIGDENGEQTKGRRNDSADYSTGSGFNMNLDEMINSMTPEVYQHLPTVVELGKWPGGVALTAEQKENGLQLVILWQARSNIDAQHMTIDTNGGMVMESRQQLKVEFGITPEPVAMFKS